MRTIFVTASGTEVGKTFVARALIHQLRANELRVRALKPVATGFDSPGAEPSDSELLLDALSLDASPEAIATISPWRFREPLSPDMSAAREQRTIPFDDLIAFCRAPRDVDVTIIEGIGGVMVPLDERHTVLDWIVALQTTAVLVVGSYLGTLSHTLTAAGMLRAAGIEVAGIIVNESPDQPVPAEETADAIARFAWDVPIRVVRRVPRPADVPDLLPLLAPYL